MISCAVMFFVYATLYATTVLLPQMLQTLMGYSATQAGLVLSPAALVTMLEMPMIGIMLSRGADARKMIIVGLLIVAAASLWMSRLDLLVSEGEVIWPRIVQVLGAGLMFVPINAVAYRFIPKTETNNASGLFSLVRNEGASIGVALVSTLLARHLQMHQAHLVGHINLLNPIATGMIHQASGLYGPVDPTGGRAAYQWFTPSYASRRPYFPIWICFGYSPRSRAGGSPRAVHAPRQFHARRRNCRGIDRNIPEFQLPRGSQ